MVSGWYPRLWLCPNPVLRCEFSAAAALARLGGGREGTDGKEYTEVGAVDITGNGMDTLEVEIEAKGREVKIALLIVGMVVAGEEHGVLWALRDRAVTWD